MPATPEFVDAFGADAWHIRDGERWPEGHGLILQVCWDVSSEEERGTGVVTWATDRHLDLGLPPALACVEWDDVMWEF